MFSAWLDTLTHQTGFTDMFRVKVRVVTYVLHSAGYLNTSHRVQSEG